MSDLPDLSRVAEDHSLAWPCFDAGTLADAIEASGWAVLSLPAPVAPSFERMNDALVAAVEDATRALYPAWLPDAEGIDRPGGGGEDAVRLIARRAASGSSLFAPYLEQLAVSSLKGQRGDIGASVPGEVRLRECYKLFLRSYGVERAILLLSVPGDYPRGQRAVLEHATAWIASQPAFPVWLVGEDLDWLERIPHAVPVPSRGTGAGSAPTEEPHITPLAGKPNPFSETEKRVEAYLARCDWAAGRCWNMCWRNGALSNPIRVDLIWVEEGLAVELDGPEHLSVAKYATDRTRDRALQAAGFCVLRFTNEEVAADISRVAAEIEQFLKTARRASINRRDG